MVQSCSINALVSVCVAQKAVSTGPVATCHHALSKPGGAGQVVGRWVKPGDPQRLVQTSFFTVPFAKSWEGLSALDSAFSDCFMA